MHEISVPNMLLSNANWHKSLPNTWSVSWWGSCCATPQPSRCSHSCPRPQQAGNHPKYSLGTWNSYCNTSSRKLGLHAEIKWRSRGFVQSWKRSFVSAHLTPRAACSSALSWITCTPWILLLSWLLMPLGHEESFALASHSTQHSGINNQSE